MSDKNTLLEVEHLRKYYPIHSSFRKTEYVQAVEDVAFSIYEGETLGIVGESGCGKSTLGRSILRLTQPTGGRVLYRGEPLKPKQLLALFKETHARGKHSAE